MIHRASLLMPTPTDAWELWSSGQKRQVADLSTVNGQAVHVGLPLDRCRSLPLRLPSKDRKLYRHLIYSQLEKRHMISRRAGPARFDYEILERGSEGALVRVDLVNRALSASLEAKRAVTFGAALRYYTLPPNKVVLGREHGRLVIAANRGGRLLYCGILNQTGEIEEKTAQELSTTVLALQGQGFLTDRMEGVELWGEFEPADAQRLRDGLTVGVDCKAWPSPDAGRSPARGALLPPSADIDARKRRSVLYVLLGLSILAVVYLAVLKKFQTHLTEVEAQIETLESDLGVSSSKSADFDAAQSRWKALEDVIDPRRYPLVQFNNIARIMPADGVILHKFESKISEVRLEGIANSAKAVFDFLENLNLDPDLSAIYNWSRKKEPNLKDDGSAEFELIGKRK